MKRIAIALAVFGAISASTANAQKFTDPFDGPDLESLWTFRSPDGNDRNEFDNGWFVFDIDANQDLFRAGIDLAPFLLTDPPADDTNFDIETLVNPVLDQGGQPNASHTGLLFFKEDGWAYTLWGPYNNADIRLEDVIGQDYRWIAETGIGMAPPGGIAETVYLKIEKRGEELEFFWKQAATDAWESAGVDEKLGPEYEPGTYQIGLFLKNWGGSIPTRSAFDYFHSPELGVLSVDPHDKTSVYWGALKTR